MPAYDDIRHQLQQLSSIAADNEAGKLYDALRVLLNRDLDDNICRFYDIRRKDAKSQDAGVLFKFHLHPAGRDSLLQNMLKVFNEDPLKEALTLINAAARIACHTLQAKYDAQNVRVYPVGKDMLRFMPYDQSEQLYYERRAGRLTIAVFDALPKTYYADAYMVLQDIEVSLKSKRLDRVNFGLESTSEEDISILEAFLGRELVSEKMVILAATAVGALIALYVVRQRLKSSGQNQTSQLRSQQAKEAGRATQENARQSSSMSTPAAQPPPIQPRPQNVVVGLIVPALSLQDLDVRAVQQGQKLLLSAAQITSLLDAAVFFQCFTPADADRVEQQMKLSELEETGTQLDVYARIETVSAQDLFEQKTKWGIKKQLTKGTSPCYLSNVRRVQDTAGMERFIHI